MTSSTLPREPVVALLRKRLSCPDAKFAEGNEAFIARKNSVLELEPSLSTDASTEAMLCSQVITLQTDLCAARTSFTAEHFSADLATSAVNAMCCDNGRLESRVSELSAIEADRRLQLAAAQSFISSAASESPGSKVDQCLGLLYFLVGQFDRLDYDLTNLLANAQNSRSTFRAGVGLFRDDFRAPADEGDILEDAPALSSTDRFLVVFNKTPFLFVIL